MSDILTLLNTVILAITAGIVLWYTWETKRLRETAQQQVEAAYQQIEVQQRPFVIVEAPRADSLIACNVGNSAAIKIQIRVANGPSTVMIPLLTPGSGTGIGIDTNGEALDTHARLRFWTERGLLGQVYALFIDQDSIRNGYTLYIEYHNVAMKEYKTEERVTSGGFEIICSRPRV
jgi:hypothetical protein